MWPSSRLGPVLALLCKVLLLATLFTSDTAAREYRISSKRLLEHRRKDGDTGTGTGTGTGAEGANFTLRVYHVNDVHVRLDAIGVDGNDCRPDEPDLCYGGYARIKEFMRERRVRDDAAGRASVFVNAGDETTGTLFYKQDKHEKIAETLNQLNFTAMTLGNHEFDGGVDELGYFVSKLDFPVVSANVETDQPELAARLRPYHVFPELRLAVIGATTDTTPHESKSGSDARFLDPVASVQAAVDEIRERHGDDGVNRIMLLSHLGYEADRELARAVTGLYYIVGGHTDTLLGDMPGAQGKYPTVELNPAGEEVFVVQDYHWGFYVGASDVVFAADGRVLSVSGKPVLMGAGRPRDIMLQAQVDRWRSRFEGWAGVVLGENGVENDYRSPDCKHFECFAGTFAADAIYEEFRLNSTTSPNDLTPKSTTSNQKNATSSPPPPPPTAPNPTTHAFALVNGGGCRASLPLGPVTQSDLYNAFPFDNHVVRLRLTADEVWDTLDGVLAAFRRDGTRDHARGTFPQVSGNVRVEWDTGAEDETARVRGVVVGGRAVVPRGRRASSINENHHHPREEKEEEEYYDVLTTDFLSLGGDNYWNASRSDPPAQRYRSLELVLAEHLRRSSPLSLSPDSTSTTAPPRVIDLSSASRVKAPSFDNSPSPGADASHSGSSSHDAAAPAPPAEDPSGWKLDPEDSGACGRGRRCLGLLFAVSALFCLF